MSGSVIVIRSQEQVEQLIRSTKVVMIAFYIENDVSAQVIELTFNELASKFSKPGQIALAGFATDGVGSNVAKARKVTQLPTIALFEQGQETKRIEGATLSGLDGLLSRFNQLTKLAAGSSSSSSKGYPDITDHVDLKGVELLNADTELAESKILFSSSKPSGKAEAKGKGTDGPDWVASDTDSQLMLYVPFQSIVKVHTIQITSFAVRDEDEEDDDVPARPHKIEIYTNRSHNLGFDEAEDTPATQSIELTPDSWDAKTNTATIETRFVKFQNVTSLVIFVVDAHGGAEKTRIDRLRILGEAGEKRAMGKLQKIGDEDE